MARNPVIVPSQLLGRNRRALSSMKKTPRFRAAFSSRLESVGWKVRPKVS